MPALRSAEKKRTSAKHTCTCTQVQVRRGSMKLQISNEADLRGLAFAVIRQSVRDLQDKRNPEKQLDALAWLTGNDAPLWFEVWGLPFANSYTMLITGAWKKFRERYHERRKSNDR